MKKMFAVICVVLIASLCAFASKPTTYNAYDNGFCDVQRDTLYSPGAGIPKVFVGGIDDETTVCGLGINFAMNGFKHGLSGVIPPNDLYGTSQAVLDTAVAFGIDNFTSYSIVLRVTHGCSMAAYLGDGTGNFLFAEDFCTLNPTKATGAGKKPITQARQ